MWPKERSDVAVSVGAAVEMIHDSGADSGEFKVNGARDEQRQWIAGRKVGECCSKTNIVKVARQAAAAIATAHGKIIHLKLIMYWNNIKKCVSSKEIIHF